MKINSELFSGLRFTYCENMSVGNVHAFRYSKTVSDLTSPDRIYSIFLFIEPFEFTLKCRITNKQNSEFEFCDLFHVPLTITNGTFDNIEQQLLFTSGAFIFKNETDKDSFFTKILRDFFFDLYIFNGFREAGDTNQIKSVIESIPLLKGFLYFNFFEYYTTKLNKETEEKLKKYYFLKVEESYRVFSGFLANPSNEEYFLPDGWYNRLKLIDGKKDIDYLVLKTETDFKSAKQKMSAVPAKTGLLNLKTIIKRYGISSTLELTSGKRGAKIFNTLVISIFVLILLDLVLYNINPNSIEKNNAWGMIDRFVNKLLIFSYLGFALFSGYIGITLFKKYNFTLVPGIFLPRMLLSIISGWVIFLTSEDLLKIDIYINPALLVALFLSIMIATIFFMGFEIDNYAPGMYSLRVFKRSVFICLLAFTFSYGFGFVAMTYINNKLMAFGNIIVDNDVLKADYTSRLYDIDQIYEIKKNNKDTYIDTKKQLLLIENAVDSLPEERLYRDSIFNNLNSVQRNFSLGNLKNHDSLFKEELKVIESAKNHYKDFTYTKFFKSYLSRVRKIEVGNNTIYARCYSINFSNSYNENSTFCTFPNMLLSRALIAMFIGIFFQLIFQDKTITEHFK